MKKLLLSFSSIMLMGALVNLNAQVRFIDKVYTDVKVTSNVTYGWNHTVLGWTPPNPPLPVDSMRMDVYEPNNDTAAMRPLVILMHAGSFLPKGVNTLPFGNKNDSAIVEMCKQFAQRGYVAAAINYRLGWNPLGDQEAKASTIINAVYRAMQDGKTAIRYFRSDAANANVFKIDPDKIVLGGSNSGGYAALAAGALDKQAELNLFKFLNTNGDPFVNTAVFGDFDGANGMAGFSHYNHPGYDSDAQLILNMGGAMGDTSWQEAGEIPMISFHGMADALTPYKTAVVVVASTGDPIIEVSGSHDLTRYANKLGNQAAFNDGGFTDVYTTKALQRSPHKGLYPFPGAANGFEPWAWYNPSDPNTVQPPNGSGYGSAANPLATKAKALLYIDTIMGYFCPRAANVLQLPVPVSVNNLSNPKVEFTVMPNPSDYNVFVKSNFDIQTIEVFDITGKSVIRQENVNAPLFEIERNNLPAGIYILKARVNNQFETKKLILK